MIVSFHFSNFHYLLLYVFAQFKIVEQNFELYQILNILDS